MEVDGEAASIQMPLWGFPGGSDGEEPACNAGDTGLIPGWGRSPGGRHGNPLQYSCLENPIDRGAWRATVHGVTKSQTQLKQLSMHADTYILAALCVMWDLSFPTRS